VDWDDEYGNGDNNMGHASNRDNSMPDKSVEGGLDEMDINSPASAYLFLSDDAQDEITGEKRKNMKCGSCGHRFAGESYESCPECFSSDTKEVIDEKVVDIGESG